MQIAGQSQAKPSYLDFDKGSYAWRDDVDYRRHPELYQVGKGEQGVLICEPYKSELVPLWRFKTPDIAVDSARRILAQFHIYLKHGEFVGADMARKFLQMGYTRARRYANYKGGRKYDKANGHAPVERVPAIRSKLRVRPFFMKNGRRPKRCLYAARRPTGNARTADGFDAFPHGDFTILVRNRIEY